MDAKSKQNVAREFKEARYTHCDHVQVKKDGNGEYLHVEDPNILATFVAFCSRRRRAVYLRGCDKDYPHSYPALYRGGRGERYYSDDADERLSAYKGFLRILEENKLLKGTRWHRKNVGAVLQHYGIKTPWLDVVRNLYTAIWFATRDISGDSLRRNVRLGRKRYSWICIYVNPRRRLTAVDLARTQSSQHVRPHAQHGVSLAVHASPANDEDHRPPSAFSSDFNQYRIARVRIPAHSEQWKLRGHMFSPRFLFPDPRHDDSLDQLMGSGVQDALDKACDEHCLVRGTLGAVYTVAEDHTEVSADSC